MPAEVAKVLVPAVEKAAKDPSIAARLLNLGMVQEYATPEAMSQIAGLLKHPRIVAIGEVGLDY